MNSYMFPLSTWPPSGMKTQSCHVVLNLADDGRPLAGKQARESKETIVIIGIDRKKCTGCGTCVTQCPYKAPHVNPDTMKAVKCDACRDILEMEKPACVAACPQRALDFGELELLKGKYGQGNNAVYPLPDPSQTIPSLLLRPHRKITPGTTATYYNMPEEIQASESKV